jgi:HSP20 family protein
MIDSLLYRPQNLFDQLSHLQRALLRSPSSDGLPDAIRRVAAGSFPPVNVARTADSIEVYAFAPGLDAPSIEVTVERGILKISGEREPFAQSESSGTHQYAAERPHGRFTRAITLPDDVDQTKVSAKYRDGLLCISLGLQQASQPLRINVQEGTS